MTTALTANLDPELPVVLAIIDGDRDAFEEFVRRHSRWVRGVIFGVVGDNPNIDDIQQHVFTAVWQQIGRLKEPARWKTWLYRLARNAAVDVGRESSRRRKLHNGAQQHAAPPAIAPSPLSTITDDELRAVIGHAIRALPALYREPFVLRHLEGWSYAQIAEVMGIPVDTVETRLVRARRQLREALTEKI